ncbi:MAG: pilus assembly protein TadG-related protein [Gaiellaceae bacterium]
MNSIAAGVTKRIRATGAERDRGAVLVLVAGSLLVFLIFSAFVVDIGRAYFAQRHLQAAADAAALAGAQELPDPGTAIAVASNYDGDAGSKNARTNVTVTGTDITTRCLSSAPGCDPVNAVVVEQTSDVPTYFAKIIGINSIPVTVKATACSPCGAKPLDIMIVLDRTGSMCMDSFGNSDPSCTDLNNAREGIKTFLDFLDPTIDWVGLGVFPPAPSVGQRCARPATGNYHDPSAAYTIVPLSNDYKVGSSLDPGSDLIATLDCQDGRGRTAYANALEEAQIQLNANGRPDVQDIVIFFSDGAANIGPNYLPPSSPYRATPCAQGVSSSAAVKATGTLVYSIGYDLDAPGTTQICRHYSGSPEVPSITATAALQGIATSINHFYNKPNPGQLNTIFTQIAADISRPSSRLVDNNTP